MKLINYTKYSTKMLRELSQYVMPRKLKKEKFTIVFRWRKDNYCTSGHCKYWMKKKKKRTSITVSLPKRTMRQLSKTFPLYRNWAQKRGYLPHVLLTVDEDIINVIAHEMRHAEVFLHPKTHKVYGANRKGSKYRERDADAYAIKINRKWRKEHPWVPPMNISSLFS